MQVWTLMKVWVESEASLVAAGRGALEESYVGNSELGCGYSEASVSL